MDESLSDRLAAVDGVIESRSQYKDGPAYWVNGSEIAHFEGDDGLDIRLTRALIRQDRAALRDDPAVELRRSGSDWITVDVSAPDRAVELFSRAAAAHRAPPGTTPRPPRR
jgi:Family of unknown function (DUF5519)